MHMVLVASVLATKALEIISSKGLEALTGEATKDLYAKVKEKVAGLFHNDQETTKVLIQYSQNPIDTVARDALIAKLTDALENAPKQTQKELEVTVNNYYSQTNDHSLNVGPNSIVYVNQSEHGHELIKTVERLVEEKTFAKIELSSALSEIAKANQALKEKGAELIETKQLSDAEINLLKGKLEEERAKNNFNQSIKNRLTALDAQNDFAQAEKLLKEQVAKKQQKELADTYFQLAGYARLQLKYKDSLVYYEEAIHLDPQNATYLNEAGVILNILSLHKEAIKLFDNALILERNYNQVQNGNIAALFTNIGDAWKSLGEHKKALEFHEKALNLSIELYGREHLYVAIVYNNLGGTLDIQGKYTKAIEYYEKALEIFIVIFKEGHSYIACCYNNIGKAWCSLGNFDKAIEFYNKALSIDLSVNKPIHPDIAVDYNNLGGAWFEKRNFEKALDFLNKALAIDKVIYGGKHPKIATIYNNLGGVYKAIGNFQKSLEYNENALFIDISFFGEMHPNVAMRYNNYAGACFDLKNIDKAIFHFEKGLNILLSLYPDGGHPDIIRCSKNLAYLRTLKK